MELGLTLNLSQKPAPQLIQSMRLLQMNMQELSVFIDEQACSNPMLEKSDPEAQSFEQLMGHETENKYAETRRFHDDERAYYPDNQFGSVNGPGDSLEDQLRIQIELSGAPEKVRQVAAYLAENLDERGYLREDPSEMAEQIGIPEEMMLEGLELLQSMNPAGVGARSIRESLLIQLEREPVRDSAAELIVRSYLEDLARSRYYKIAHDLKMPVEEIYNACDHIRNLNPFPADNGTGESDPEYLYPDIVVENTDDGFKISSTHPFLPRLSISEYYFSLLKSTSDPEVRTYLNQKLNQAQWVIGGISRRANMLTLCTGFIVGHQKKFFSEKNGELIPLTRLETAAALGVNVSTVSRAVKGKYLQCRRGVFPLDYFFSRGLGTEEEGSRVSSELIKAAIHSLIKEENAESPISDQDISDTLREDGYIVSRRTVAKYRQELGIPNTAGRRAVRNRTLKTDSGSSGNEPEKQRK